MLKNCLLVAAGGAFGSVLRFLLQAWVQRLSGSPFPFGTLSVNVLGCVVMGFLWGLIICSGPVRDEYRLVLMTGVLGGFTTFSAFGLENYELLSTHHVGLALTNLVGSCALGLGAVWLGAQVAQRFFGTS